MSRPSYDERLHKKGKRRVTWILPAEVVAWVDEQSEERVVGPAKFVELVLKRFKAEIENSGDGHGV